MRRAAILAVVVLVGCSGGGSHPSTAKPPATAATKGALEAGRACRMWLETIDKVPSSGTPNYALLDAMAGAVSAMANQASADDPAWNELALDVAGGNDFKSAAMVDVNNRIAADCKAVPSSATKSVAAEPDPFTTTTVTSSTTAPTSTTG